MNYIERFFSTDGFMPHGMCYEWNPTVIWLNVVSDGLIALAYYSIPLTLLYFVRKRKDLQFSGIFLCFAMFIIACGTTHLMEIWNIWQPVYWLSGFLKAATAAVSVITAILLLRLVPKALALPSPSALQMANHVLRESEERYRRLVESVQDYAIFGIDTTGKIADWNLGAQRIVGYTAAEIIGKHFSILFTQEDIEQDKPARELATAIEHGHSEYEGWRLRKNGTKFWANAVITALRDEQGNLHGFSKVSRDVTERRLAEEQIAEQAAFLDKARDAILVRDLDGKILFWNNGAERMYGWSREEAIGQTLSGLLYTDPEKFKKTNGLTISHGEWRGEFQHFARDRREIIIEGRLTLIRNNEGQPKSVLEINSDITERKKIETQFMRAQRMESIGTLAGGIAHDLNNILLPIMMSIDLLNDIVENPQAKSILDTIRVSAKRGADIVRQVLSFARGQEGERIEIQPKHLLQDLESIVRETFPKDILVHCTVPSEIWVISGDPTQLQQILLNLCVNARDAMPNGGNLNIIVENTLLDEQYAAMHIQAKVGRYVCISVMDSGVGIPHEIIDKIFEPFFTTKEVGKGTGLGLSTVMAIVQSHSGFVNVYSEPGKGSTFKVYIPATEASQEGQRDDVAVVASPSRGNGETILVVDDEASILTITSQTLQAFGYRTLTANDGAEAVAIYVQFRHKISAVLTDMAMPLMDGAATIRALLKVNPDVKIVAVSGLQSNGSIAKASKAGVRHFLTKPYTAGTLLGILRTILDEP
jgi:PAS domain S-box-containing protein